MTCCRELRGLSGAISGELSSGISDLDLSPVHVSRHEASPHRTRSTGLGRYLTRAPEKEQQSTATQSSVQFRVQDWAVPLPRAPQKNK
jgi:hypothetical protein